MYHLFPPEKLNIIFIVAEEANREPSKTGASEEEDICGGHWQTPRNCNPAKKNCEYYAKWEYLEKKDEVKFTIQTTHTDLWTGIGFSDDQKMVMALYLFLLTVPLLLFF